MSEDLVDVLEENAEYAVHQRNFEAFSDSADKLLKLSPQRALDLAMRAAIRGSGQCRAGGGVSHENIWISKAIELAEEAASRAIDHGANRKEIESKLGRIGQLIGITPLPMLDRQAASSPPETTNSFGDRSRQAYKGHTYH